jgi:polar amino acid transport system substrate-binding protein
MNPIVRRCLLLLSLLPMTGFADGQGRLVRLATLEWPPYNSVALPGGGLNTSLVRQAFAKAGYRLEVVTMPWVRAVDKGTHDPAYDGFFPEYLSVGARRDCFLSARAGDSPVGLARLGSATITAGSIGELVHYRVGVVNGYNNTEAFDENVRKGLQQVDRAETDEQNLLKLLHHRVDLAIVDRNVMLWLLAHSPHLKPDAKAFQFVEPPLQVQGLYICFKRTPHGQQLSDAFSGGLMRVDVDRFSRRYLDELLKR